MKKRAISFVVAASLLAFSFPASAQQPRKVFRIGFLDPSAVSSSAARLAAFRQELSKLGWIEGKNIAIEYRLPSKSMNAYLSLRPSWCVLRLM